MEYTPNIENIRKWVDALRSGDYQQGQGALHNIVSEDEHYYCCLGVACDLSGVPVNDTIKNNVLGVLVRYGEQAQIWCAPDEVLDWLGFDANVVLFDVYEGEYSLIELNDECKYTFNQIADIIEDTFLK